MHDMHDGLRAHDTDAPAQYVDTGGDPVDPVPGVDWSALAAFLPHRAAVIDTARDVWERATVDRVDVGTVLDVARSLVTRIERAHTERAAHTGWHGHRTTGDADPVTAAPDPYERVKARTVSETSNRGVTVQRVTVHGRGYVGGDVWAQRSPGLTMTPARLAHVIDTAPRTATGHTDGIALARITAVAYPDVPDMLGGDVLTWHERPTYDDTMARQARRGWPVRTRLATVRARTGETSGPRSTAVLVDTGDVPSWEPATVTALLAPAADPAHAWRGHTLHERPETARARRSTPRRVSERVTVRDADPLGAALAAVVGNVTGPYTAVWSWRGTVGTVTVTGDRRPRLSVTGLPDPVRGYRTARGLARAVDRVAG